MIPYPTPRHHRVVLHLHTRAHSYARTHEHRHAYECASAHTRAHMLSYAHAPSRIKDLEIASSALEDNFRISLSIRARLCRSIPSEDDRPSKHFLLPNVTFLGYPLCSIIAEASRLDALHGITSVCCEMMCRLWALDEDMGVFPLFCKMACGLQ